MKLEAYRDRARSAKGEKDARDLVTIARVAGGKARQQLVSPYLRDSHLALLDEVAASPVFTYLTKGNAHEAKALRKQFSQFVAAATGRKPK
jgi:hypothetical protein